MSTRVRSSVPFVISAVLLILGLFGNTTTILVMLKPPFQSTAHSVLIYFLLTVKAATLIFIYGRCSAISSAKEGKSGFIYNLVKS